MNQSLFTQELRQDCTIAKDLEHAQQKVCVRNFHNHCQVHSKYWCDPSLKVEIRQMGLESIQNQKPTPHGTIEPLYRGIIVCLSFSLLVGTQRLFPKSYKREMVAWAYIVLCLVLYQIHSNSELGIRYAQTKMHVHAEKPMPIVKWTPNIFEMDPAVLRRLCQSSNNQSEDFLVALNSTEKSWPNYIDFTDSAREQPVKAALDDGQVRFAALHFPQWYPDPINNMLDDWRYFQNPNFTHNRNGIPMLRPKGHIYYDQRCIATRKAQAALAHRFGLDAFIFYIYYGDNKWVLDQALEALLQDGEPDIDFALMWPNEEFAHTHPQYDRPDLLADILSRFFQHPRYLKVNGHPLFYIYIARHFDKSFADQVNTVLESKYHIPKMHLVAAFQSYKKNYKTYEHFDGYNEFPPNIKEPLYHHHGYVEWKYIPMHQRPVHLGMALNFDNTPRKSQGDPHKLPQRLTKGRYLPTEQSSPKEFRDRCIDRVSSWLLHYEDDRAKFPAELDDDANPKVVLFFAWNEWSEQAALEPSDLHGYGMLEALSDCKQHAMKLNARILAARRSI